MAVFLCLAGLRTAQELFTSHSGPWEIIFTASNSVARGCLIFDTALTLLANRELLSIRPIDLGLLLWWSIRLVGQKTSS